MNFSKTIQSYHLFYFYFHFSSLFLNSMLSPKIICNWLLIGAKKGPVVKKIEKLNWIFFFKSPLRSKVTEYKITAFSLYYNYNRYTVVLKKYFD